MERLSSELLIVAGNTDSFVVDDLLDFSNDDGQTNEDARGFDSVPHSSSSPVSTVTLNDSSNSSDTSSFDLYVPSDDIAELEWLSNLLVEETFSTEDQEKLHFLSGRKTPQTTTHQIKTEPEPEFDQFIDTDESNVPVPAKARSKRSRSAASTWASRLLSLADESNTFKKQQRMIKEQDISVDIDGDCNGGGGGGRRCLHCATEKTPQWRTGPMGPKTLCNACGVRYKSGRLVPEYRPASSPTFVMARHSNSHRKVMELRRQKEMRDDHLLRCDNLPMDIRSNGPDFFTHNFNNHVASDFRHLI